MNQQLPVLFVSHGSPLFALEPGLLGEQLTQTGRRLQEKPIKAVLAVSAHWQTRGGALITASEQPETVYDFGGFPEALYTLTYPVKGEPQLATQIRQVLRDNGFVAELEPTRGLDHGVWVPLRYLFPHADIPVIQLSMPQPLGTEQAAQFGQALKSLRSEGVLIVASGSQTHNLHDVRYDTTVNAPYVQAFVDWTRKVVGAQDINSLIDYRTLAPYARQAHPTQEHFLPLFIALGASDRDEKVGLIDGGISYAALSMDAYIFGDDG